MTSTCSDIGWYLCTHNLGKKAIICERIQDCCWWLLASSRCLGMHTSQGLLLKDGYQFVMVTVFWPINGLKAAESSSRLPRLVRTLSYGAVTVRHSSHLANGPWSAALWPFDFGCRYPGTLHEMFMAVYCRLRALSQKTKGLWLPSPVSTNKQNTTKEQNR